MAIVDNRVHKFFNTTNNYLHQSFGIRIRSEIVRELVGEQLGMKMLDVGCGNGTISSQYLQHNQVAFLDLSENMIEHVKESIDPLFADNANFFIGAFTEVEIKEKFDFVLAIGLLAHVPSVSGCLSRINSMLAPRGKAIIQFSDYDKWLTRFNIKKASKYGYPINHLSYGSMKQLITTSGFEIIEEVRFSFLLPGMGKLPDSFLYRYSKVFWRNGLLSQLGTDIIWVLTRKEDQ